MLYSDWQINFKLLNLLLAILFTSSHTFKTFATYSCNFSQQFSAILEIEFDLVDKLVAKRSCREVVMCVNVYNFRLSNFE